MTDPRTTSLVITGGAGFLGSRIVELYRERGVEPFVPRSQKYDLRNRLAVRRMFDVARPSQIIHCAATVGGIGANRARPAAFLNDNLEMGMNLIDEAAHRGISRFVLIGTSCSYPAETPAPFREQDLWNGYPEATNAPYGIAKRTLIAALQAYANNGLNSVAFIPANLYGPGDNFDLTTSHVIPAVIRKITGAHATGGEVRLWGDGSAARDFLHVDDAAEGIVELLNVTAQHEPEPFNLGTGRAVRIDELAQMVAEIVGYRLGFEWETRMPNGQRFRCLDTRRAAALGWRARRKLYDGLVETIAWWRGQGAR
jgi:GDP-L-fucose synthase